MIVVENNKDLVGVSLAKNDFEHDALCNQRGTAYAADIDCRYGPDTAARLEARKSTVRRASSGGLLGVGRCLASATHPSLEG